MAQLLEILFSVGCAVTVVTVVGHVIWLVTAAVIRAAFGIERRTIPQVRCVSCGHPKGVVNGQCQFCGHETTTLVDRELTTASYQIEQLHQRGLLSDEHRDAVSRAIALERGRLRGPLPTAPPERRAEPVIEPSPAPDVGGVELAAGDLQLIEGTVPASRPGTKAPPKRRRSDEEDLLDAELVEVEQPPAVSPFDEPDVPAPHPVSVTARRTLADMLQAFMEEKNIRWGELASGMLIVGSAIGLVVSFRATLAELSEKIPYLPALFFMIGTALIHGAGLYTLKRWNLRSTSRGVLIIATLLIPLNFAAGIVLSGAGPDRLAATSPLYIAAALIGILGYGAITYFSSRALLLEGWWRLLVVVMGTSIGQMIINRLAVGDTDRSGLVRVSLLFALPLASYLYATGSQAVRLAAKSRITPTTSNQTFLILGVSLFRLAFRLFC